jgi:hypothetical protein
MNPQPPPFPHDEIASALGDHPAGTETLKQLQGELTGERPDPAAVAGHVETLRGIPAVRPFVESWLESPATQHWLSVLGTIGL